MSEPARGPGEASEAFWKDFLRYGDPRERAKRRFFERIPASPRCKACAAPFKGVGATAMRFIGRRQSTRNPGLCNTCFDFLISHRGGAEVEITMLFADIRGSTTMAERMSPGAFHDLLNRFYKAATDAVFDHGGGVDKYVGDEVVAQFMPLTCGEQHARNAVGAAQDLLKATGHGEPGGPWVPVGVGVHTGSAWVGAVGDASHVELTAIGDAVNTAARLASSAPAGQVLVSTAAARAAGVDPSLPVEALTLKGKELPFDVVRLGPTGAATASAATT